MKQGTTPKLLLLSSETSYQSNPTQVFRQLCGNRPATMLLESSETHSKEGLRSLLIVDSALRITTIEKTVTVEALSINGASLLPLLDSVIPEKITKSTNGNTLTLTLAESVEQNNAEDGERFQHYSVMDVLRSVLHLVDSSHANDEAIFMGGLFAYDLIQNFEELPKVKRKNNCPDYCFYLAETLLVFDHQHKTGHLQASLFTPHVHEHQRLLHRLVELKHTLSHSSFMPPKNLSTFTGDIEAQSDQTDAEYAAKVKALQIHIQNGDIFQIVPSRTFLLPCPAPLASYEVLKENNPSPYMFYMQDSDFILFGSSPESALKFSSKNRQVEIYPIAGTRPRGLNPDGSINHDLDSKIELEMRTDHKELAEHIMLLDLARNDIASICETGTRQVIDLIRVDRYSQVMHLVSHVIGTLRPELDALHAYQSCMNMGTLTGCPKVRAMELIAKTEQQTRGSYGGAIGYFTAQGNFDTCIVIRSAYVEDGMAHIQAGAGVVYDSNPILEAQETFMKAKAVIKAIKTAHQQEKAI
ncbi:MAG: anthranilate synthase component 1 [Saezia sp.]